MIRLICAISLFTCLSAGAAEIRVEVDGVGCHTRQLAVQKIWNRLPEVKSVTILPRAPADPPNRRVFLINAPAPPDSAALTAALGSRSRFYKVIAISAVDSPTPALPDPATPTKVRS